MFPFTCGDTLGAFLEVHRRCLVCLSGPNPGEVFVDRQQCIFAKTFSQIVKAVVLGASLLMAVVATPKPRPPIFGAGEPTAQAPRGRAVPLRPVGANRIPGGGAALCSHPPSPPLD